MDCLKKQGSTNSKKNQRNSATEPGPSTSRAEEDVAGPSEERTIDLSPAGLMKFLNLSGGSSTISAIAGGHAHAPRDRRGFLSEAPQTVAHPYSSFGDTSEEKVSGKNTNCGKLAWFNRLIKTPARSESDSYSRLSEYYTSDQLSASEEREAEVDLDATPLARPNIVTRSIRRLTRSQRDARERDRVNKELEEQIAESSFRLPTTEEEEQDTVIEPELTPEPVTVMRQGKKGAAAPAAPRTMEEALTALTQVLGGLQMNAALPAAGNNGNNLFQTAKVLDTKITKFDGEGTQIFSEWLKTFVNVLEIFAIPVGRARTLLPLYLTGLAKLKYDSLTDFEKSTWNRTTMALAKKLKVEDTIRNIKADLMSFKMGNQTFPDYCTKIKNMCNVVFQGRPHEEIEKETTYHLIHGLNDPLRSKVERQPTPNTLEEAINLINKHLRISKEKKQREMEEALQVNALLSVDRLETLEKTIQDVINAKVAEKINEIKSKERDFRDPRTKPKFQQKKSQNFNRNFNNNKKGHNYNGQNNNNGQYYKKGNGKNNGNGKDNGGNNVQGNPNGQGQMVFVNPQYQGGQVPHFPGNQNPCPPPQAGQQGYSGGPGIAFLPYSTMIVMSVLCLLMGGASASSFQICGFHAGGIMYRPPETVICPSSSEVTHKLTAILYEERRSHIIAAKKCFKEQLLVKMKSSWFGLKVETEVIEKHRVATTIAQCQEAGRRERIDNVDLEEFAPEVLRSKVQRMNESAPWFGESTMTEYIYTVEKGSIHTLDGKEIISTLGDVSGCSFSEKACLKENHVIIWDSSSRDPWCPFKKAREVDVIIRGETIVIPEMNLVTSLEVNTMLTKKATANCEFSDPYFTNDGLVLVFPTVPRDKFISSYLKKLPRQKRETLQEEDESGKSFEFDLVPFIPQSISQRLFGTNLQTMPNFETRPITKEKILQEIKFFNVTNDMLSLRSTSYPRSSPQLTVLRVIRFAEYRYHHLRHLQTLGRRLTHDEKQSEILLKSSANNYYDIHLNREFPAEAPEYDFNRQVTDAPFFNEEDLKNLPPRNVETPKIVVPPPPVNENRLAQNANAASQEHVRQPLPPVLEFDIRLLTSTTTTTSTTSTTTTTTPKPPVQKPVTPPPAKENAKDTKPIETPNEAQSEEAGSQKSNKQSNGEQSQGLALQEATVEHRRESPYRDAPVENVSEQFTRMCYEFESRMAMVRAILHFDTTEGARLLFRRTDIVGKMVGDVLLISECQAVEPTTIHWNHKVNKQCFKFLPVELKNEIWFVKPGTRDLVEESPIVDCQEVQSAVLLQNDEYRTEKGVVPVRALPFRRNTVSSKSEDDEEKRMFYQLSDSYQQTSAISRILDKLGKMKNWNFHEEYQDIINVIKTKTNHTLTGAYEKASSFTQSVKDGIKSTALDLIFSVVFIGFAIAVAIVVFCLLGYCYIKMRLAKTVTSAAAGVTAQSLATLADKYAKAATAKKKTNRRPASVNNVNIEMESLSDVMLDLDASAPDDEKYTIPEIYAVIGSVSGSYQLPYIQASINGAQVRSLVDSGAAVSYMRASTLTRTGITQFINQPPRVARAANGSAIKLLGAVWAKVQVGAHSFPQRFEISRDEDCPAEAILGSNFIRNVNEHGQLVSFDLSRNAAWIGRDEIPLINAVHMNDDNPNETPSFPVRMAHTTCLDGVTENAVEVIVDNPDHKEGMEYLIEDNSRDDPSQMYMVGRTLVRPDRNGNCFVLIINPSATTTILYQRRNIGNATLANPPINAAMAPQSVNTYPANYVPPEAHWEKDLPRFPEPVPPNFDIAKNIDLTESVLDNSQKERLRNIIRKHAKAFVGPDGELGCYNGPMRHRIDLVDNYKIPNAKLYRAPLEKRKEIEAQIGEMLRQGIIEPSDSAFCAPIVLVRKADKKQWRFTIDYRGLNAITKASQSILPQVQDIIDLCANQKIYTVMDFHSGFHQIPIEECHRERTAFGCWLGSFHYLRVPQGLKSSPSAFQKIMNDMRKRLKARVFIYIDDLIITSPNVEQHLADLDEVLGNIESIGMKLKLEKCKFAQKEVKFLGFILNSDGVRPDPDKTRAIDAYPRPKNVNELRSFLGLCSFLRRFVPNFAQKASPLHQLTRKDTIYGWNEECEQAFKELKRALVTAPVLVAPRLGAPFVIETDASGKGLGAVLKQGPPKDQRIVAYASRTLNKHESRYPAIELEALGVVFAIKQFMPYIDGAKVTLITDHAPLSAVLKTKDLRGRLEKYAMVIMEHDVTVTYRPGTKNALCDALSRNLPEPVPLIASLFQEATWANLVTTDEVREEQKNSDEIQELIDLIRSETDDERVSEFLLFDEVLYKISECPGKPPRIVIPNHSPLRFRLIETIHRSRMGTAHMGIRKTKTAVSKLAVWRNMDSDVHAVVANCEICQRTKDPNAYRICEPLGRLEAPVGPMERVHADFIGPLRQSFNGNKYILAMVDAMTKYAVCEAVPNQQTSTLIRVVVDRLVSRFGTPRVLVTDNGSSFVSKQFKEALKLMGITHKTCVPYHHQSNGVVERFNRTIEELIAGDIQKGREDWDENLQLLTLAYNSTQHDVTKFSPFYLVHGREPNSPFAEALTLPIPKFFNEDDYCTQLKVNLQHAWEYAHKEIEKAQEVQEARYNTRNRARAAQISVGDKVLLKKETRTKIDPHYGEEFTVEAIDYPNLEIKDRTGKKKTVHLNQVKIPPQ